MYITSLTISNFRNIEQSELHFSKDINFIIGSNGSGKTSLLEAIYHLGVNKSFRTTQNQHCIKKNSEAFNLFAKISGDDCDETLGLSREQSGKKQVRRSGEKVKLSSETAKLLPTQLISVESARIFCEGPSARRDFINWGLFHVEHDFNSKWQTFQKALKQRNSALKNKLSRSLIENWNLQLSNSGEEIVRVAKSYSQAIAPLFQKEAERFIGKNHLKITYYKGWKGEVRLIETLESGFARDYQLGYTQAGPQRADLIIQTEDNLNIHTHFSQGQNKLVSYILRISQGKLLSQLTGKRPVYIIDDLPSELDKKNKSLLAELLITVDAQIFITAISEEDLTEVKKIAEEHQKLVATFHVKHGEFQPSETVHI